MLILSVDSGLKLEIICAQSFSVRACSPVYGLVQQEANQDVYELLHQLALTDLNIQDSTCYSQLHLLQAHAPVLAEFICRCLKEDGEQCKSFLF